jgi:hypothetical protein
MDSTSENDKLFGILQENKRMDVTFPSVNAMGTKEVEETKEGGLTGFTTRLGNPMATANIATGKFGGSGGANSRQLTPGLKARRPTKRAETSRK